jgi:hypothetical protein
MPPRKTVACRQAQNKEQPTSEDFAKLTRQHQEHADILDFSRRYDIEMAPHSSILLCGCPSRRGSAPNGVSVNK